MKEPVNPYTERADIYRERAKNRDYVDVQVFFADKTCIEGQESCWDEGFIVGNESWFNLDSENDCADTLFVFLAILANRVEQEFGSHSAMGFLLQDIQFALAAVSIPINPPETEDEGVWVQPFEYADEPH